MINASFSGYGGMAWRALGADISLHDLSQVYGTTDTALDP